MESRGFDLKARRGGSVVIRVIPGHFATKNSHINYCIDITKIKSDFSLARAAARLFAESFCNTPIDTIITLERMKMVGAFLANELSHAGINLNNDFGVITPEVTNNQLLLRDNLLPYVKDKRVLVMCATSTTGITVKGAIEGIRYYGGEPVGLATVFGGAFELDGLPVVRLVSAEDLPDYASYPQAECPLCKNGVKVDALVNTYGYSRMN